MIISEIDEDLIRSDMDLFVVAQSIKPERFANVGFELARMDLFH